MIRCVERPTVRRQKRGQAKLLGLSDRESKFPAYGWIQSWKPFRRKFGMLADDVVMLGPYWTARPSPAEKACMAACLSMAFIYARAEKRY